MVLGSAWVWGVVHTGGGAARPIFTTLLRRGTQLSLVPIVLFMHPTTPGHTLTLPPGEVPLGLLVVGCGTASSPPTILVSLPPTIHQRDTPIPWICLGLTSLRVKVNFLARCGQKSDLSGLCGIGYWVSGLVKCLPQSQWLLQSYKRSFDGKSNIKESSKSVAITII